MTVPVAVVAAVSIPFRRRLGTAPDVLVTFFDSCKALAMELSSNLLDTLRSEACGVFLIRNEGVALCSLPKFRELFVDSDSNPKVFVQMRHFAGHSEHETLTMIQR